MFSRGVLFLLAGAIGIQTARASLSPGWSDGDFGSPSQAGSAVYTNGLWTLSGGGLNICTSDQFHFAWTLVNGDMSITAQVLSVANAPYGQAGVMLRADSTPGALEAAVLATTNNGITFQWRSTSGNGCSYQIAISAQNLGAPLWVRLVRSLNNFSGYYSTNGADWLPVGVTQTVSMPQTGLAGLAVTAGDGSSFCTATFSNVGLSPTSGIYRELWTGLNSAAGDTLAALTNISLNPNWPDSPNSNYAALYVAFETPTNSGMTYYGQRLRTFIVPPTNGNYSFWISSDNTSQLLLSADETTASAVPIAWVSTFTGSREWTQETNQQSAPVNLRAGCRYYLEALMQHSTGNDNLAVRWQLPNGTFEEPLAAVSEAGTHLIPCDGVDTPPGIYSQPANLTVEDGSEALFSVLVTNSGPVSYQWLVNGTNATGANANSPVYVVPRANPNTDNGLLFNCVVSNPSGAITSAPALLTVIRDTTPPAVVQALYENPTNVLILFSEPLDPATATNTANYVFTNGVPVLDAILNPNQQSVSLTTPLLILSSNYVLVLNRIQDLASTPNVLPTNTIVSFFAGSYTPQAIGGALPVGTISAAGNGYYVTGGGTNIGGTGDQFQFTWQLVSGDFDFSVRLDAFTQTDPFALAGLMVRQDLTTTSPFAAVLATPSLNGIAFETRTTAGGTATKSGSLRVNYPDTWLRLQKVGSNFTGYASYDGLTWQSLGATTFTVSNQVYLGMAICSHTPTQAALAQFSDLTPVTNATVTAALTIPREPLGPCSRLTPFVISEIMYKPAPRTDSNNVEYVEFYNSNPYFEDLSGFQIAGGSISYTFPPGTILSGGAFLVVAASPTGIQNVYGITNVIGPYTGTLKKSGTIELIDAQGGIVLTVPYSDAYPWPVAAHGTGHSIFLANPTYGEGDPRAWDISDVVGGSPGQGEAFRPSPLRSVLINEVLAHTENPGVPQFIELYNHSSLTNDLSGCILTDDPTTNKFLIPSGTLIGPGGFVSFDQTQLGFSLDGSGGTVYFIKPDGSRVLDAVQFEPEADGVSYGRWPDGAADFYPLLAPTPGTNNSAIWIGDIVINELMYDPLSGNDDDQYVELYNKGTNTVSLANWQFSSGISFAFPANVTLAPDSYLVIARNQTNLFAKYPNLNAANTLGNYGGKLSHKGERVALTMPQLLRVSGSGGVTTNTIYVVQDEVTYGTGGRWGQWSKGGGSSLELINPNTNHRLAYNWTDSDDTAKSVWTNLEFTGVLDLGGTYNGAAVNLVQVGLLDIGECLVDDLEVLPGGTTGTNIVANGDFQAGMANWSPQGDHLRSSLETASGLGGYQSSQSLHLRSSDGIWTLADSVQGVLTQTTLGAGQTATLRLKARWLRGWPEVLMRLRGNWLEVTGKIPVPPNLGTPGLPNSARVSIAAPAMYEIKHSPALPPANQAVVVSARFHDFNPFQATLRYRIDTGVNANPSYTSVAMVDNGTGGDVLARDGIFSGTIPGQPSGTVVAFQVVARDISGATSVFPQDLTNNAGLPRECVVAFGDPIPIGSFSHHHVFITQNWAQRWAQWGGVSHEYCDGTWVDGGGRTVYNWRGRYAGSPYHQYLYSPVTTVGGMHWLMPEDDPVFGTATFNKQHVPGNGPLDDNTIQREQTSYWMARQIGLRFQNRRYYFYYVNGVRHAPLMEDSQVPGAEMLKQFWPNDNNGILFKNHSWFEGDVAPQSNGYMYNNNMSWCVLGRFTTTINGVPQYKAARYRWMWWLRQYTDSASDFSQLYALIDAANTPTTSPAYYANMESQVDTENWLRLSAMEHATGDWDSLFTQNQWNMYCYKPTMGKWTALKWDWNITLGSGTTTWPSDGSQLFNFNVNDPVLAAFQNYPAYQRAYLRALQDIANLAMNNSLVNPVLDAKYAAFAANGITTTSYGLVVQDPGAAGLKSWIGTMHNSILTALNNKGVSNIPFVVSSQIISNNVLVVNGTAPLQVKTLWFNGVEYPVTWPTITGWTVTIPLQPGTNQFNIVGVDLRGNPVAGASSGLTAFYPGTTASPIGQVVINEVMYNPALPDATYIELYNNSTTTTFDLSAWQIPDLGYSFPAGSLIGPNAYLVLAGNPSAFASAYGGLIPIFDTFPGQLSATGQELFLTQPSSVAGSNVLVAAVKYGSAAPWPSASSTMGSSLQLIDPQQDNWRVGNWSVVLSNSPSTAPQWQYVTLTGTAPRPILLICMHGNAGDVYLDDIKLVAGSVPEVGANLLTDGDFETPLSGPWTVSTNLANSVISTTVKHSGNASLHVIASSPGDTIPLSIWENTAPIVTNGTYTLSYWYLPSTNGTQLLIRLSGSSPNSGQIYSLQNIQPQLVASSLYTPGAPNSTLAALPAFPPLWLNELQADNLTGITNAAGQHTPWLELYNPSTNLVDLSGLFLADDYAHLTTWAFPVGSSINPGQFKVIFADGQTALSTSTELHTSFTLSSGSGSLALSRLYNGQPQVLDYVDYTNIAPDHSYGSVPDGQSFDRQEMASPTPGTSNNAAIGPSFVPYTSVGEIYAQNFDALPNPGSVSVNSANPVTINGVVYSLANPFDFAAPILSTGGGGLGLPSLAGWYGLAALIPKFGATDGDQTTGGVISFGLPGDSNRALGLLATSSTGGTAFGARFINYTGSSLNYINVQFTAELWRQSNLAKNLACYYTIDPTGTAPFPGTATGLLPALDASFPTDSAAIGGVAVDGTSSAYQSVLSVQSQVITNWPPGGALWLVWQMGDPTGKSQGLAIDNFSFSASDQFVGVGPELDVQAFGTSLVMSWPTVNGQLYQMEYKDDLNATSWTALGSPVTGTGATLSVTNDVSLSAQRFFRLRIVP